MNVRNKDGYTAMELLELTQPPGYKEILHWYKKLTPGMSMVYACAGGMITP